MDRAPLTRRSRPFTKAVGLSVIPVIAAAFAAGCQRPRPTSAPPPSAATPTGAPSAAASDSAATTPLPPLQPRTQSATANYLATEGRPLEAFRQAAAPLLALTTSTPPANRLGICATVHSATSGISADSYLQLAGGVPDAVLQELEIDDYELVSVFVNACQSEDLATLNSSHQPLVATSQLLERRLKEIDK